MHLSIVMKIDSSIKSTHSTKLSAEVFS